MAVASHTCIYRIQISFPYVLTIEACNAPIWYDYSARGIMNADMGIDVAAFNMTRIYLSVLLNARSMWHAQLMT